ncbi:MAG TPA: alcohol dehydrogenase catalytic domain-containing protein [Acidimicrobiia bacterium]|jgi:(R,R)-butanediol dehydrogenase/meso-butanediol dehydrogenase/diacetyl reductase
MTTHELPATMRAAVYHGQHDIAIEDVPVPDLGPREVLLSVSHCGICGSDLHFVLEGWGRPGSIEGHEWSGRVVAVGADVSKWSIGDEVVGGPSPRCGECEYCRAGRPALCTARNAPGVSVHRDGAFAEFVRAHEDGLLRIPDAVPIREAALAEPLAVALHGLTRGGVRAGQRVLVTGAGPIGALSIAAARARGVDDIVASEPHPRRRALAEQLGARPVLPDTLVSPAFPGDIVDEPFDVALECSGTRAAMEAGLGQLKRGGTLVLVGAGMQAPRFDPNRILLNELVITGSFVYDADGFERALELLARPDFPSGLLLEADDVALDDLYGAIEGLASGELPAKVLVVPWKGTS